MIIAKIIAIVLAGAAIPFFTANEACARSALSETPSAVLQQVDDDDDDSRNRYWSGPSFRDPYDRDRDWDDDRDDDDDDDDDDDRRDRWRRG